MLRYLKEMPPLRYALLIGALLAAIGGYAALWRHLAGEMRAAAENFIALRRAEGHAVSHGPMETGGFPFRLALRIEEPSMTHAASGINWRSRRVTLFAQPWNPRHLIADAEGPHEFKWLDQGGPRLARLETEKLRASIVTADGGWRRLSLEMTGAAASVLDQRFTVARLLAHARPAGTGAGIDVALEADKLEFPAADAGPLGALGRTIGSLAFEATASGAWPGGHAAEALGAWRDSGGIVDVKQLRLAFARATLSGNGAIGLDPDWRPLGAFSFEIQGHNALIDAFVAGGSMSARDAQVARIALGLLSKPAANGEPMVSAPVTAQDGRLFVGPVAVSRLRPIFQVLPPPAGGAASTPAPPPRADGQNSPRSLPAPPQ
jgi:hypothetical protein